jgi:hypothetical protein
MTDIKYNSYFDEIIQKAKEAPRNVDDEGYHLDLTSFLGSMADDQSSTEDNLNQRFDIFSKKIEEAFKGLITPESSSATHSNDITDFTGKMPEESE